MSREKSGFRDTIAMLNELFPNQIALNRTQVASALGVNRTTVMRRGIKFNDMGLISKADLARQICI